MLAGVATIVLGVFPGLVTDISNFAPGIAHSATSRVPGWRTCRAERQAPRSIGRSRPHRQIGLDPLRRVHGPGAVARPTRASSPRRWSGQRWGGLPDHPEVGPLFGTVVEYLDRRWEALGCPDPFVVVEAAAGRGAGDVGAGSVAKRCRAALRYVLVERSEDLRRRQSEHLALGHAFEVLGPARDPEDPWAAVPGRGAGPLLCSLEDLPVEPSTASWPTSCSTTSPSASPWSARSAGGTRLRVTRVGAELMGSRCRSTSRAPSDLDLLVPDALPGARVPLQSGASDWLRRALSICRTGSVIAIDYTSDTTEVARRPQWDWLHLPPPRSLARGHWWRRGPRTSPARSPWTNFATVRPPTRRSTQADWLVRHGIGELVEEGRRIWNESAARPGLAAMRARSRVNEAAALVESPWPGRVRGDRMGPAMSPPDAAPTPTPTPDPDPEPGAEARGGARSPPQVRPRRGCSTCPGRSLWW